MSLKASVRSRIKAARKRGAMWVRLLDIARLLAAAEGRSVLWTRFIYGNEVHQTTPETAEERYPELFDSLARLMPAARRILSFGCSTGEELVSLRRRFPNAELVGADINPRARRIAKQRTAGDRLTSVIAPDAIDGTYDLVLALAVLQREPHKIAEMGVEDLSPYYPFARFDAALCKLAARLRKGGLLCVDHAQYRVEDSSVAPSLGPVPESPISQGLLFGPDGRPLVGKTARAVFRKR
jgi:hypothetical protein